VAALYGRHIAKVFGGAYGEFIGHDGGLPGYQTFMGYSPQKDGTIVVLTNLFDAPNTYADDALPADAVAQLIAQQVFA
jgi:D-alanyl-D-alanine carboxypeptidase